MRRLAAGLIVLAIGAGTAAAETWHPFSFTPTKAYMADVDSIRVDGEITSVLVAAVPRTGDAGDYGHTVETYEVRCGAGGAWRTAGMIEYGPDGTEIDRYPEDGAAWEEIRPDTLPVNLKQIVCEGRRANPPIWPTVRAFVDAGRG